jgi:hypothetical protein
LNWGTAPERKIVRIHTIATHRRPHFDEIVAIWLLLKFGETKWPGISQADMECWESLPEGKTSKELLNEGFLLVGIGGGPYDEHPQKAGRKEGQCAATLVAHDLRIERKPALRKILEYAAARDLELGKNEFELPAVIKAINDEWPTEETIRWAFLALIALHRKQERFYDEAPRDYAKAVITDAVIAGGRKIKMVVGRSNADTFCAYARSGRGCHAGVVVQMSTKGNVLIQTNQQLRIDLGDVVRMLRVEELRRAGKPIPPWKTLGGEKNVEACWYLHPKRGMILNGSATCAAPPTKIPLETIDQIVRIGINPAIFPPERAARCKSGICTSSKEDSCPWYVYGLDRCRTIRSAERAARSASELVTIS